ncbi:MAG TPA: hypothetical protein VFC18_18845 [Burkholderiales bacterium]|nr:hypothetical protein [Burkholderiales bacterium]
MARLVEDLSAAIAAAFETDEYRNRHQEIHGELEERHERAINEIGEKARAQGIALVRTPSGFGFGPFNDKRDAVIEPEEFAKLSAEAQKRTGELISQLQKELAEVLRQMPKWRREALERMRSLDREVARTAIVSLIEELKGAYEALPHVLEYLDQVKEDTLEHAAALRSRKEGEPPTLFGIPIPKPEGIEAPMRRYAVNVLIEHSSARGAPVVYEDHPSHAALVRSSTRRRCVSSSPASGRCSCCRRKKEALEEVAPEPGAGGLGNRPLTHRRDDELLLASKRVEHVPVGPFVPLDEQQRRREHPADPRGAAVRPAVAAHDRPDLPGPLRGGVQYHARADVPGEQAEPQAVGPVLLAQPVDDPDQARGLQVDVDGVVALVRLDAVEQFRLHRGEAAGTHHRREPPGAGSLAVQAGVVQDHDGRVRRARAVHERGQALAVHGDRKLFHGSLLDWQE